MYIGHVFCASGGGFPWLLWLGLVVGINAINCLDRLVSEITYYVSIAISLSLSVCLAPWSIDRLTNGRPSNVTASYCPRKKYPVSK